MRRLWDLQMWLCPYRWLRRDDSAVLRCTWPDLFFPHWFIQLSALFLGTEPHSVLQITAILANRARWKQEHLALFLGGPRIRSCPLETIEPRAEIKIQLENRRSGIILHFLIKGFHCCSYFLPVVEHPMLTRQGLSIKDLKRSSLSLTGRR